ncbi:MAG: riboflavin synthase [Bacteroidia bacterium]
MFSGIVEAMGRVVAIRSESGNIHFRMQASFLNELKIDQSIAHNGVCLTVVDLGADDYEVTAIAETLQKTNLGKLQIGDAVNLERCLRVGDRLDGHIVQGHVDLTGVCVNVQEDAGSWRYQFRFNEQSGHVTVGKGSICINGVSLTVVDAEPGFFSVAIIPYTYEHTTFKTLKTGDAVNLEFDILGKYIAALMPRV